MKIPRWRAWDRRHSRINQPAVAAEGSVQEPASRHEFDETFYRSYYPDLADVADRELYDHFAEHGREEGRFANARQLTAALEDEYGPLPDGFVAARYAGLNPDLRGLRQDWQFVEHYLAFGRPEGRRHASGFGDFCPDHFRETNPAFETSDDAACEAAWLLAGGAEAEPANAADHLAALGLGIEGYPEAFPWRYYVTMFPRTAVHRWSALAHFLHEGFARVGPSLPYGPGAAAFLVAVADRFVALGQPLDVQAFELAAAAGPLREAVRLRMADAYMRAGCWSAAHAIFTEAALRGTDRASAMRGASQAGAKLGRWDAVFALYTGPPPRDAKTLDALARETTELFFADRSRLARSRYAEGRRPEGDAVLAEAVGRVADLLEACGPAAPQATPQGPRTVLVVADTGLSESARRRLALRATLLAEAGCALRLLDIGDVDPFDEALPDADAAVFLQVPAWPSVVRAIVQARRLGVPTLYETDALTIDPEHAPEPLAAFDGRIAEGAYHEILFGTALYRAAAALCDYGIAPDRILADHLDRVVRRRRSFTIREARDVSPAPTPGTGPSAARLFVRTTRVASLGARDGCGSALLDVLERHPDVGLTTSGFVTLGDEFAPFASRIHQLGPAADHREALRGSDVNLAVAPPGEIGECESVANWLEAAAAGVATLASATRVYRAMLDDGRDVVLAASDREWRSGLDRLLGEPDRRAAIAAAARAQAEARHGPAAAGRDCRDMLDTLRKARSP